MFYSSTRWTHLALACGLALSLIAFLAIALGYVPVVQARSPGGIYMVTSTDNNGAGTLRRAIFMANASPGADTIQFDLTGCPCTILLTNGLPLITETLTIQGLGANQLTIDGNDSVRVFHSDNVPVTISDLTIQRGNSSQKGAGILSGGALTLIHVNVLSNTATLEGGGVHAVGPVVIDGGRFENNRSTTASGGGLIVIPTVALARRAPREAGTLILTDTQFISNTAGGSAGAAFVANTAVLNGGIFERNHADNFAGGLYVAGPLALINTEFISNQSTESGGGMFAGDEVTIDGGRFENNRAGGVDGGGGLAMYGTLTLTSTQFISNTANELGGGAHVEGDVQINGARFERNFSSDGGGGLVAHNVMLINSEFISNSTPGGGGGLNAVGTLTMSASTFLGNSAARGGGVYHWLGDGLLVNSLFARNTAVLSGTALYLNSTGNVNLIHDTIASPTLASGSAIYITTGTLRITNTIIASQTVGVYNAGGTVVPRFNLSFGNGATTQGPIVGAANNIVGDPRFANPAIDNYHLITGSAAIDAGTNSGITIDFDGDTRAQDDGFDIGYDEFTIPKIYLPLVMQG